jgi:hypothetical protein
MYLNAVLGLVADNLALLYFDAEYARRYVHGLRRHCKFTKNCPYLSVSLTSTERRVYQHFMVCSALALVLRRYSCVSRSFTIDSEPERQQRHTLALWRWSRMCSDLYDSDARNA